MFVGYGRFDFDTFADFLERWVACSERSLRVRRVTFKHPVLQVVRHKISSIVPLNIEVVLSNRNRFTLKFSCKPYSYVCDCAKKARSKGYTHFTFSNYFECWSGKNVARSYKTYKANKGGCIDSEKKVCTSQSSSFCAGIGRCHFVYSVNTPPTTLTTTTKTTPTAFTNPPKTTANAAKPGVTCGTMRYPFRKLGCWREFGDRRPPRAMPELLLTARDQKSSVYAGYSFDRFNYSPFLER